MYVIQGNGWIDLYHMTIIKDWKAPDMWAHYGLRANSAWGNDPMGCHEINLTFCKCQNGTAGCQTYLSTGGSMPRRASSWARIPWAPAILCLLAQGCEYAAHCHIGIPCYAIRASSDNLLWLIQRIQYRNSFAKNMWHSNLIPQERPKTNL